MHNLAEYEQIGYHRFIKLSTANGSTFIAKQRGHKYLYMGLTRIKPGGTTPGYARYSLSMHYATSCAQLSTGRHMCNITSDRCIIGLLTKHFEPMTPWHAKAYEQKSDHYFGDETRIHFQDFPIFLPPSSFKFPFIDLVLSTFDKTSRECNFDNCSLHLTLLDLGIIKTLKHKSPLFSGKCKRKDIALFNDDPVYICAMEQNKGDFQMISWEGANKICKQQNKSLPSFNSRNEIISFVNYLYQDWVQSRMYEEIAVYIDLKRQVRN